MKTTFIFKINISIQDDDLAEITEGDLIGQVDEVLCSKGYKGTPQWEKYYPDRYEFSAVPDLILSKVSDCTLDDGQLKDIVLKDIVNTDRYRLSPADIRHGLDIAVIRVGHDNIASWAELYGLEEGIFEEVSEVLTHDGSLLEEPERIPDYIKAHKVGDFPDVGALAGHLASIDPKLQAISVLAGDILPYLDLVEYYTPIIRSHMWNSGTHWYWDGDPPFKTALWN